MKQYLKVILFLLLLMLVIPMIALIGDSPILQDKPENHSSLPMKDEMEDPASGGENTAAEEEIKVYLHDKDQVVTLKMSDYIKSVVCAEMPASFSEEAIKAQTVLAHTYALRIIKAQEASPDESLKGAQISTDPAKHQAYLSPEEIKEAYGENYDTYWAKISSAADAVMDRILTYESEPIVAAFHAISGGYTESAKNVWGQEVPYLISASSEGDLLSPHYEDTVTYSKSQVKNLLKKKFPKLDFSEKEEKWFQILSNTPSGYVATVSILGETLTGVELRSLFSLKSANFSVSYENGDFVFTTKGYGHGVGMSQYGADYFARQGKNYEEILSHYFPGTTLTTVEEGV